MHVNKGDRVIVIAGNDKGKTGTVLEVDRKKNRLVIEGVNRRIHHVKPTQQAPQGSRSEHDFPIHASNVLLLDPQTGKGTRKRPQEG